MVGWCLSHLISFIQVNKCVAATSTMVQMHTVMFYNHFPFKKIVQNFSGKVPLINSKRWGLG